MGWRLVLKPDTKEKHDSITCWASSERKGVAGGVDSGGKWIIIQIHMATRIRSHSCSKTALPQISARQRATTALLVLCTILGPWPEAIGEIQGLSKQATHALSSSTFDCACVRKFDYVDAHQISTLGWYLNTNSCVPTKDSNTRRGYPPANLPEAMLVIWYLRKKNLWSAWKRK